MSIENSKKSAFPKQTHMGTTPQNGLTKREYFAAMAMQGLLASGIEGTSNIAQLSVNFSDEILKQLSK